MPIERQPRGEPIGLRSLEFSQIPDRVFDYWLYHLTGAQFKILAYICRRTYGFKKERDAISLDQICNGIVTKSGARLDWGTGLSREGAIQSLKRLEELGLVLVARTEIKETNQHFTNKYTINISVCSDNEGYRYGKNEPSLWLSDVDGTAATEMRAGRLGRLREQLGIVCDWTCVYCGKRGNNSIGPDERTWHIDHYFPRALGGDNHSDNLVLSCATCNLAKRDSLIADFMGRIQVATHA